MENQKMTLEEILQILEDAHNRYLNMTPEERRDCRPQSKLLVLGDAKITL